MARHPNIRIFAEGHNYSRNRLEVANNGIIWTWRRASSSLLSICSNSVYNFDKTERNVAAPITIYSARRRRQWNGVNSELTFQCTRGTEGRCCLWPVEINGLLISRLNTFSLPKFKQREIYHFADNQRVALHEGLLLLKVVDLVDDIKTNDIPVPSAG